jgi:GDPmannose 4,6-dehydratase
MKNVTKKLKKNKKSALIFGISGQDGAYLAHFLLEKGYKVIGTTREKSKKNLLRLSKLGIFKKVNVYKGEATNNSFCKKIISSNINEIYYLAGDSSVVRSFDSPQKSLQSNTIGILNILEYIKKKKIKTKVFNSGSGQFYGDNKKNKYNLESKIEPQSPYGVSKAAGYWLTKIYREKYNLFSCTGVLFNHESTLRSKEFVTKKIVDTAKKIKKNNNIKLRLGNINIYRDWGWAPEYVEAFWLMLQNKKAEDLIIGSGTVHSLKEFVNEVFKLLNINKKNLVTNVKKFRRKLDIRGYKADIALTQKKINWKPKTSFKKIIYKMVNDELY